MEIVIGTKNEHKIEEIKSILKSNEYELLTYKDFENFPSVIEDGKTILENSIKKAKEIAQHTGKLTISDDSGIEIDYLNGEPGVLSARYAGEDVDYQANNKKMLEKLLGVPYNYRTARFRCIVAIAEPDGNVQTVEGTCDGKIALKEKGNNGFGYDPIFIPDEYKKTFAEMTAKEKNKISHRGIAFSKTGRIVEDMAYEYNRRKENFKKVQEKKTSNFVKGIVLFLSVLAIIGLAFFEKNLIYDDFEKALFWTISAVLLGIIFSLITHFGKIEIMGFMSIGSFVWALYNALILFNFNFYYLQVFAGFAVLVLILANSFKNTSRFYLTSSYYFSSHLIILAVIGILLYNFYNFKWDLYSFLINYSYLVIGVFSIALVYYLMCAFMFERSWMFINVVLLVVLIASIFVWKYSGNVENIITTEQDKKLRLLESVTR